jgi:hypothetical protein
VKWKPLPNRKNDLAVLEVLTETDEFSAKDLKEINRCRIYLRVFFISDISTYDGQQITDWARKGRRDGGRKEVVLGMASSTAANIVESMEIGPRLPSTRWLCCIAIGRLARIAPPTVRMVPRR